MLSVIVPDMTQWLYTSYSYTSAGFVLCSVSTIILHSFTATCLLFWLLGPQTVCKWNHTVWLQTDKTKCWRRSILSMALSPMYWQLQSTIRLLYKRHERTAGCSFTVNLSIRIIEEHAVHAIACKFLLAKNIVAMNYSVDDWPNKNILVCFYFSYFQAGDIFQICLATTSQQLSDRIWQPEHA